MANYPSYDILLGSTREEDDGIQDDFGQGGTQHSRTFYSQSYFTFNLVHILTTAQIKSLRATYTANPRADYTLTFYDESPQQTYTVKFTGPPQITSNITPTLFRVEVPLRGTAD